MTVCDLPEASWASVYVTVIISPWLITAPEANVPDDEITLDASVKSYSKIPELGSVSRIVTVSDDKSADFSEPLVILTSIRLDEILSSPKADTSASASSTLM